MRNIKVQCAKTVQNKSTHKNLLSSVKGTDERNVAKKAQSADAKYRYLMIMIGLKAPSGSISP